MPIEDKESAQKICLVTKGAIPGVYKSEADARAKNPGPIEIRLFKNLDELGEACRMHLLADNDNAGDSEDPSKTAKAEKAGDEKDPVHAAGVSKPCVTGERVLDDSTAAATQAAKQKAAEAFVFLCNTGKKVLDDSTAAATPAATQAVKQKAAEADVLRGFVFSGIKPAGSNKSRRAAQEQCNNKYVQTLQVYNERPVWLSASINRFVYRGAKGLWFVTRDSSKFASETGLVKSATADAATPVDVEQWQVYDGKAWVSAGAGAKATKIRAKSAAMLVVIMQRAYLKEVERQKTLQIAGREN